MPAIILCILASSGSISSNSSPFGLSLATLGGFSLQADVASWQSQFENCALDCWPCSPAGHLDLGIVVCQCSGKLRLALKPSRKASRKISLSPNAWHFIHWEKGSACHAKGTMSCCEPSSFRLQVKGKPPRSYLPPDALRALSMILLSVTEGTPLFNMTQQSFSNLA